jgi:hypothetical protein
MRAPQHPAELAASKHQLDLPQRLGSKTRNGEEKFLSLNEDVRITINYPPSQAEGECMPVIVTQAASNSKVERVYGNSWFHATPGLCTYAG